MFTYDPTAYRTYFEREFTYLAGFRRNTRRYADRTAMTDPATGDRSRVDEPALLLWVHCAEIDSYLHVARRSGLTFPGAYADAYIREQRTAARLVGLDPRTVPGNTAALDAYFERVAPDLAATPESAEILLALGDGTPDGVQGRHVSEAARQGDPVAVDSFRELARWAGAGLADLASLFDPSAFIVGGGVSRPKQSAAAA